MPEFLEFIIEIVLPILLMFIIMAGLVFGFICCVGYFQSSKEAEIYNRLNGTNFSASDFFWASSQINSQTQTINIK